MMDLEEFMIYIGVIASIGLFLFLGLGLLSAIFINTWEGSQGEHTGIVTAVEHNDNLFWDSDIAYFKTDERSSQEDKYCIANNQVMEDLKRLSALKEKVTITFSNPLPTWNSECNGGISIITGIKK